MNDFEPLLIGNNIDKAAHAETGSKAKALALLSQKQNNDGIISELLDSFKNGQIYSQERSRLILWGPVVFGFGAAIGCGLLAGFEANIVFAIVAAVGLMLLGLGLLRGTNYFVAVLKLILLSLLIFGFGVLAALARTEAARAPVFASTTAGNNISGTIIDISRSYNGGWRAQIKLDFIEGISAQNTPIYARLSIRELRAENIGGKISCFAQLQTPPIAVAPGAYDFARKAWFSQIGSVGFCKSKPIFTAQEPKNLSQWFSSLITRQRLRTSALLADSTIGGGGGFLAAVFTGDRSWMSREDTAALQASGLHHIVSVSGMHITLIAGIVYFSLLKILALVPIIALRFDVRKIAAIVSMLFALVYTIFSGAEAPAVRAVFMCFVVLGAILLDRRAISMRGLAIAALLLLILRPENAIDAGFQMSFLATMALVGLWESFNQRSGFKSRNPITLTLNWLLGALLASFVAGLATMPIAVHNFGNVTTYALAANLIATPISDFIVAPFSLLGVLFSIINLSEPFFAAAKWGLDLILMISYVFASAPIASVKTNPLNEIASFLLVFATLWLCLWKTKIRFISAIPLILGGFIWLSTPAPSVLIAPKGNAVLSLAKNNLKVCFVSGAKFDAKRLIAAANLNSTQNAILMAQLDYPNHNKCRIVEGDFEAHYINPKKVFKTKNLKAEPTQDVPILSVTFNNKSYALDSKTAPLGAVMVREKGILKLTAPHNTKAPWLKLTIEN